MTGLRKGLLSRVLALGLVGAAGGCATIGPDALSPSEATVERRAELGQPTAVPFQAELRCLDLGDLTVAVTSIVEGQNFTLPDTATGLAIAGSAGMMTRSLELAGIGQIALDPRTADVLTKVMPSMQNIALAHPSVIEGLDIPKMPMAVALQSYAQASRPDLLVRITAESFEPVDRSIAGRLLIGNTGPVVDVWAGRLVVTVELVRATVERTGEVVAVGSYAGLVGGSRVGIEAFRYGLFGVDRFFDGFLGGSDNLSAAAALHGAMNFALLDALTKAFPEVRHCRSSADLARLRLDLMDPYVGVSNGTRDWIASRQGQSVGAPQALVTEAQSEVTPVVATTPQAPAPTEVRESVLMRGFQSRAPRLVLVPTS